MDAPQPNPWADLDDETPDVADWPIRVHPPRRWSFELGIAGDGDEHCPSCDGRPVADQAALTGLITAISNGSLDHPCTCACCVVPAEPASA